MVNKCANPQCAKPLHYLREGRIFVFDLGCDEVSNIHRLEHFWLCGQCSQTMLLEKTQAGIHVARKPAVPIREGVDAVTQSLAS